MLKILDINQTRELDAHTIKHEPIASIDLMERVCVAFVDWFTLKFDNSNGVGIVCGTGNNGGDGLGIARLLTEREYIVAVYIVRGGKESRDFATNLEQLQGSIDVNEFGTDTTVIADCDILIDALFGSGLSRPAEGIFQEAIEAMNNTPAIRISVDIPSGLFADKHTTGPVVKANYTVTFQLPKLAFMLPENNEFVGEWHMEDIGLDPSFIMESETSRYYVERNTILKLLKKRGLYTHKGDYGHALMIAGSIGKMGASVLAARGALRAGVGLLTVHVPQCGIEILQTAVPEAMVSPDKDEYAFTSASELDKFDAVGIGPGIGQSGATAEAMRAILHAGKPLVIDADAINLIASNKDLLDLVPHGSILTPHPGEFRRLVGPWHDDFDRLAMQSAFARQCNSIIVVKGAHTAIAAPDGNVYFNCTGNPGMATGGSGDVLTGILTSLKAQGYASIDAALLGVYLHGLAGDLAEKEKGVHSLIAGDLVDYLAHAFRSLT